MTAAELTAENATIKEQIKNVRRDLDDVIVVLRATQRDVDARVLLDRRPDARGDLGFAHDLAGGQPPFVRLRAVGFGPGSVATRTCERELAGLGVVFRAMEWVELQNEVDRKAVGFTEE